MRYSELLQRTVVYSRSDVDFALWAILESSEVIDHFARIRSAKAQEVQVIPTALHNGIEISGKDQYRPRKRIYQSRKTT